MPMLAKRRVLAAKIETTVGTAISLAAADATFNAFNVSIQPDIPFNAREGQGNFSGLTGTLDAYGGTAKFSMELTGGASIPAWATTFLPACGMVASSLVMSPQTNPPGTGGVKTLTIGSYVDGIWRSIKGAMGNAVFRFEAGKRVMVDFEFKGIWVPPTDVAILAPTYTTVAPLRFVSSGLTVGAFAAKCANITIDLGNQVVLREDSADSSGFISAMITDRKMKGSMDPEAALVATRDNLGIWLARTEGALAISLGASTNGVAFAAPKLQLTNVQEANRNDIYTENLDFVLNRSASLGDDELTITFQ
jgi:hypothetical protein